MKPARPLVIAALLAAAGLASCGPSGGPVNTTHKGYEPVPLGYPLVTPDHVLFNGNWEGSNRLVCIERKTGRKLWENTDAKDYAEPWRFTGGQAILVMDDEVCTCDPATGKIKPVYRHPGEIFEILVSGPSHVFLIGTTDGGYGTSRVNLKTGEREWFLPDAADVLAQSGDVALIRRAQVNLSTLEQKSRDYVGISVADGNELWRKPLIDPSGDVEYSAVYTGKNFLATMGDGALHLLEPATGKRLEMAQLADIHGIVLARAADNGLQAVPQVVAAVPQRGKDVLDVLGNRRPTVAGMQLMRIDPASLAETPVRDLPAGIFYMNLWDDLVVIQYGTDIAVCIDLGKKDVLWDSEALGIWDGIHGGNLYSSVLDEAKEERSIIEFNIRTQATRVLYQEVK